MSFPTGSLYVRFSGTAQAVHGSAVGDSDGGTVAMVVVPQALPGGSNALFSFNDNGTHNGPQIYYDGTHYIGFSNGSGTSSNAITPIIGKPDILWLDYAGASGIVMRANSWASGSRGAYTTYTPTQFSVAFNGFVAYYQLDIYALFRYSARLTGSNLTDLETYLYQTYIPTILSGLPSSHLIGLWRADQESYADGDLLGAPKPITDQSGAGNNLDLTAGGGVASYKTNIYNGRAVYRFSGTRDLSSTAASFGTSSRQHTTFGIGIPRGSIAAGTVHVADHSNNAGGFGGGITTLSGTPNKWQIYEYDGANQLASGGAPAVDTASLLVLRGSDGQACVLRENKAQIAATSSVGSLQTSTTKYTLGGNQNGSDSQIDFPVWGVYDTPIGGQWLTDVETWLSSHYQRTDYVDTLSAGSYTLTGQSATQGYGNAIAAGSFLLTGLTLASGCLNLAIPGRYACHAGALVSRFTCGDAAVAPARYTCGNLSVATPRYDEGL